MGSISMGNSRQPKNIKNKIRWYQGGFLAKEYNSFHLSGKKLDYLHCKDFLRYECELYLKQPLTLPQCKTIIAYRTVNHRLAIKIRRWSTIPIPSDDRLSHYCSYNAVENEAHFMSESPLYNPIGGQMSITIWECSVREHHVDISLYLTEATALRHYKKPAGLKPS